MQIPASETTRRVLDLKSINAEAAAEASKRKQAENAVLRADPAADTPPSNVGTYLNAKA